MSRQSERRAFPRRAIHFNLQAEGRNHSGSNFQDLCQLISVSGNGAKFHTGNGGWYFRAQELDIKILLPGPPEVAGWMQTQAHVIRIDPIRREGSNADPAQASVAIAFRNPLQLGRNVGQEGPVSSSQSGSQ